MVHQRKYVLEGTQKLWLGAAEAPTFLRSWDPGVQSTEHRGSMKITIM